MTSMHNTCMKKFNSKCKVITKHITHKPINYAYTIYTWKPISNAVQGVRCLPNFFSTYLATIYLILKRVTSQNSHYTHNNQNPPIVMLVCIMYLVRFNIHVTCNLSS